MENIQNEIISFSIITITVLFLAFLTRKLENKYSKEDKENKPKG